LPVADQLIGRGLQAEVLAGELVPLVAVVVAADAAVLAEGGRRRDHLDKVAVVGNPNAQVGVNVIRFAPAEDPVVRN